MYDPMANLREWHKAVSEKPFIERDDAGRRDLLALRTALITEEYREATDELLASMVEHGDLAALLKELCDLLYVIYGTAEVLELPIYRAFEEVHRSNMSKVEGGVVRNEAGKVLKGPSYTPADMQAVLEED